MWVYLLKEAIKEFIMNKEKLFNEKVASKYWFYEYYIDFETKEQSVIIILSIDYRFKKYSITTFNENNYFNFINNNNNNKNNEWRAVLKAINTAIDFAEKELNKEIA